MSAVEQALAPLDAAPDLVCVFVSGDDPDAVEAAARRAMQVAGGRTRAVGCSAAGVIGGGRGVEDVRRGQRLGGGAAGRAVGPVPARDAEGADGPRSSWSACRRSSADDVVGVLLADPYPFPVDAFVERSSDALPGLPLVGGLASGGRRAAPTRLFVDGGSYDRGAVGVVLGGSVGAATVVSQGGRPIGPDHDRDERPRNNVCTSWPGCPRWTSSRRSSPALPPKRSRRWSAADC